MSNSFWLKGFYFERRVYFYNTLRLYDLIHLRGLSFNFYFNFFLRLRLLESHASQMRGDSRSLFSLMRQKYSLCVFDRLDARIILINLLLTTFPVFLEYVAQQRSNIWKHFLMKSKRGLFLRISRPLGRRTRARTFLRKHQTKRLVSEKPSRIRRATGNWF
jgi:hypothetical protein